ncbi:MAG: hydantoinase B/oxoprolinase family protein [Phormidesmis sp.]
MLDTVSASLENQPEKGIGKWQFWIDRGGTFTDMVAQRPDGSIVVHKLLSENPGRYHDAPLQGIRDLMGVADGQSIPAEQIAVVKMGTTVATNALLERKGDRTLFVTTKGFRDALRIGYQHRPDIFARKIVLPEMLYAQVIEVNERMTAEGEVRQPITPDVEEQFVQALQVALDDGIRACAISLIHGYRYPKHEQHLAAIAQRVGFTQVSTSHQVSPLIKWVSRSDTTVVDAYLSPLLRRYVNRIEQALGRGGDNAPQVLFMQSNGGLTPATFFQGKDSILSGPAGGIVGAVQTSRRAGYDKIITFDMGGTSTDVAHYKQDGEHSGYERVFETEVAGVRLRAPMMAIHTVAAGGGSVVGFDGDRLTVGPDSAGAHPGPTCYRNDGPLTVTDCNVMVGKIQPQFFPKVFGPEGDQPLDYARVCEAFMALSKEISVATKQQKSPEAIAEGFLEIAINNMANAIKKISVQRGYDISDYTLCCFGAAGGQHACRLAETLGMKTILIHPYAGVLSAYGMGLADRRVLKERSVESVLTAMAIAPLSAQINALIDEAMADFKSQGMQDIEMFKVIKQLHLRYEGTDSTLAVLFSDADTMKAQFEQNYQQQYGITLPDKAFVVATANVEVIGQTKAPVENIVETLNSQISTEGMSTEGMPLVDMFSAGAWHKAPVFHRHCLHLGQVVLGPAIVLETTGTNVIEPGWQATVDMRGNFILSQTGNVREPAQLVIDDAQPDPVRLEIFSNLFQAIAQQMGFTLQNTSSSVNIKERLDFSCAIFDGAGQLVANAPHIPVHLGSMGESVQALIASRSAPVRPGDVFISNNPYNGGTHLPDITAITPVFIDGEGPLFFVAARGHHADIGGITPGSMPPNSTHLAQEGILFDNFLLVENGEMKVQALRDYLTNNPYPARNLDQNIADLQAQIAANNKGVQEIQRMVAQFGLRTVQAYMQHVQDNAEKAIRQAIARLQKQPQLAPQSPSAQSPSAQSQQKPFTVPMDCGASITVSIRLNDTDNSAVIDFAGTSPQQPNNFNAPLAVCKAAVLYVFRTLVSSPIPLNAGCLKPLDIRVPAQSLLSPTFPSAVVAGNVETSQAITDALYGALGIMAASQGTMNNFTFGNSEHQYYETICGGSGAGIDFDETDFDGTGFDGTDAVQTHMTNSRLTDPEILELRFPVLLKEFSIRDGSGGSGKYKGGNGTVRHFIFCQAMTTNLLSGRRTTHPFGLAGGQAGRPGEATVQRLGGNAKKLGYTATVDVSEHDEIIIETPGGGGYGRVLND